MNWQKKDVPPELVRSLAEKYGCDILAASILARRGLTDGETVRFFLEDDPRHLRNPFLLPAMEDAVDRLLAAKEEGERILVFGDRDVDGITSTALVAGYLAEIGCDVRWRVPMGDDAYGLTLQAVEEFAADYGSLIVTVDCGVSNLAEIDRAAELGVDVVVLDHHNPQAELPRAHALVNPKLADSRYPWRDLAGCGVAYKLVSALRFALGCELYGQTVCLLDARPVNDAYVVEAVKLRNLVAVDRLSETVVPGVVSIERTRLVPFLQGWPIFAWDAPLQKRVLAKVFGSAVEIGLTDAAPEIGKAIPAVAGASLLRVKELSKLARYADAEPGEMDVFVNLFTAFAQKQGRPLNSAEPGDLQLAALGTLADLMPLRDENRILVRSGLQAMLAKPRPGLSDLLFKLSLAGRRFGPSELAWQVCPAINASGRMGSPDAAVRLLLEADAAARDKLADAVVRMNEDRKKLGADIWTIVEPMAEASRASYDGKLAVAFGPEIHRGVTGIMANRLVGRFKLPAMVVATNPAGTFTGSMRSTRGFDVRGLLEPCADLFIDWGGHDYAAGFSLVPDNWPRFLERLALAAAAMELADGEAEDLVEIDAELPPAYMTPDILKLVDRFEPYGEANDALTFLAKNVRINQLDLMGKPEPKHVRLTLDCGKHAWPAVYWQAAERVGKREFAVNDRVDIVFKVGRNWFGGAETPQLVVIDLRRP
jgi:single-stranded-DNA-specific exonuclease